MREEIYAYPHRQYTDGLSEFVLVHDTETDHYSFEIETILEFKDETEGPINFMKSILADFTDWMIENGHRTNEDIKIWDYFDTSGVSREYDSIEKAYGVFRRMLQGFFE